MGLQTTASGNRATAMGQETTAATIYSLSIGAYNSANSTDDGTLFVVGNGSPGTGDSDALVLDDQGNLTVSSQNTFSDRRLKTDIEPLGGGILQRLGALRPVRYRFRDQKTHPSGAQIGLIAQDIRKEFPELVSEGSEGYLSLAYPKMTAVLLKGLQEQQAQLEAKESEVASLKAENEALEMQQQEIKERLAALEQQRTSALPAGLAGPLGLAVLLGLGGLGVGLLWRRRT